MEEKKVISIDDNELDAVAGGAAGFAPQAVILGVGDGSALYVCPECKQIDFKVIGQAAGLIELRCKNCGTVSYVTQD